jgi:hypothetical protein
MIRWAAATLLLTAVFACGGADSTALLVACDGAASSAETTGSPVNPEAAAEMTIAEMLGADPRFTRFHALLDRTMSTGLNQSWLEIFDWPASRMGDSQEGVTVFVPDDAAFERLDPGLLTVIEDPQLDNEIRYTLVGHHYVHSLYPSSEFEAGPQRTWRGAGSVELTLEPLAWGGCPLVQTDIRVSNGYIHVVDGIVIPADLRRAAEG